MEDTGSDAYQPDNWHAGYRQAYEWFMRGLTVPYARPANAFERGWDAGLEAAFFMMSESPRD